MTKTKKAGIDGGNSSGKMRIGEHEFNIPSVYAEQINGAVSNFEMADIAKDELIKNLDFTFVSTKALKATNKRYIIGEKVLKDRSSTPVEMELNSNKAEDELPVIVSLAGLALEAMLSNEGKDKITASYDLSVALPYQTMKKGYGDTHSDRFIGTHELIFHHPSGRNVNIAINIEYAKSMTEGAAGAWGVVYDDKGKLKKRDLVINGETVPVTFENRTILHTDIGAGSTELVVTNGVKYDPVLSQGLNYGVKKTIEDVIVLWNDTHDRPIDSVAEFNDIYINAHHDIHTELRSVSRPYLEALAKSLAIKIKNMRDKLKDNPLTFIYGGGAIILKEYLTDALKERNSLKNVFFLEEPVFVNAKGLYVFTTSPIFDQLKKTTIQG
ncbi:ParM/StbA family protein [Viridibacillus arvi]|uniref:ParM/StbA family protein n=1 Tax=Viridibacillus arvi TaxID=263475 RepID=UPI0034CEC065